MKESGDEIKRRFDQPFVLNSGKSKILEINLAKASSVNQFLIQEDITNGHKVKTI